MVRDFTSIDDAVSSLGEDLGVSNWRIIDQHRIDLFAAATGDHQWIHVDAARAEESTFGATIAHGFLTLAMIPDMTADVVRFSFEPVRLNYGLDKVRFVAPVLSGSRVRDRIQVTRVEQTAAGVRLTYAHTIEIEGAERPACIAETITLVVT